MDRILESRAFRSSARISRFLEYIVGKTIGGCHDDIREYNIGLDVFDRGHAFDPRIESVVRVEARRLRRTLADYYANEGRHDEIRIDVPKGSYVPVMTRTEPAVEPAPGAQVPALNIPGIAVLPFFDLSPERNQEHFCDGMTEQLTDLLTGVEGIRPVSATSCFAIQRGRYDVREIGEKLKVQWIVEGSLRKAGDRLRVSVRLSSPATGFQLWAATYDHDAHDLLRVQDEIGSAVIEALKPHVGIKAPAPRTEPTSIEAYEHFLCGRHHYAKQNRPGLQKAIASFEQAIAADPRFAAAHIELSRCYRQSALMGVLPAVNAMPEARSAALRALTVNPSSGEALGALAAVLAMFDLDWDAAEARYEQALGSAPVTNDTRHSCALFLLIPQRRFEEALRQLELARDNDPLSPLNGAVRSWTHFFAGRLESAIAHANSVLEMNETSVMGQLALGWAFGEAGRSDEAIEILEHARALTRNSSIVLGSLGLLYGRIGRKLDAREILSEPALLPYDAALVHMGLGEVEAAINALERVASERCPRQVWIGVDPRFAGLQVHGRFVELLSKLGLPEPRQPMALAAAVAAT